MTNAKGAVLLLNGTSGAGTVTYGTKLCGRGVLKEEGQKITIDINSEQSGRQEQSPEK